MCVCACGSLVKSSRNATTIHHETQWSTIIVWWIAIFGTFQTIAPDTVAWQKVIKCIRHSDPQMQFLTFNRHEENLQLAKQITTRKLQGNFSAPSRHWECDGILTWTSWKILLEDRPVQVQHGCGIWLPWVYTLVFSTLSCVCVNTHGMINKFAFQGSTWLWNLALTFCLSPRHLHAETLIPVGMSDYFSWGCLHRQNMYVLGKFDKENPTEIAFSKQQPISNNSQNTYQLYFLP